MPVELSQRKQIKRYRVDEENIPMSSLNLNKESTTTEYGAFESSSIDINTSKLTENPYFIREMARKNVNSITSSTKTILQSTQHYSYSDILQLIFNGDGIEVQTRLSSRVSMWIITAIGGFIIIFDILLTILEDPGALFPVGVLFLDVVIFTIALSSDNQQLSFKVP